MNEQERDQRSKIEERGERGVRGTEVPADEGQAAFSPRSGNRHGSRIRDRLQGELKIARIGVMWDRGRVAS